MILADKIITLRKKAGWSQEELASQLGVTRQSVSKWEGAQSVPDLDKVVQMSRLFGVSTDYLLKDELEEEEFVATASDEPLRRVTMEQASRYLALRCAAAPKMALATFLCVISPVCLLLLAAMSEVQRFGISENAAAGIGLCILLALVAVGVSLVLSQAARVKEFDFLEKEPFETEYGVSGMVRERRRDYQETHTRRCIIAAVLCILSAVPLFAAMLRRAGSLLCGGGLCAVGDRRDRRGALCAHVYANRRDGSAFGGGGLYAQKEGAQRRNEHGVAHLLAERDGDLPLLHVRSHGQRAAAQQLVYLGRWRRTVCGGDGYCVARAASQR